VTRYLRWSADEERRVLLAHEFSGIHEISGIFRNFQSMVTGSIAFGSVAKLLTLWWPGSEKEREERLRSQYPLQGHLSVMI
jgi:hypothetical protein